MRRLFPLAVLALFAFGCQPTATAEKDDPAAKPKPPNLVGKWAGHVELGANDKAGKSEEEIRQAEEQLKGLAIDLEVLADGKYNISGFGDSSSGSWALKESNMTLTELDAEGKVVEEQVLTVEDGGNKLVGRDPDGESDSVIVFIRA